MSAIAPEDPPLFSSLWPRVQQEKYMRYDSQIAIDALGKPQGRDLEDYCRHMGIRQEGKDELLLIPPAFAKVVVGAYRFNKALRPNKPYDVRLFRFNTRVILKFLTEYRVDFSRATIDGRHGARFDPDDALPKIEYPMLLPRASWSRHETWGLLGAVDDEDAERMSSTPKEVRYAKLKSAQGTHIEKAALFLDAVQEYLRQLAAQGWL